MSDDDIEQLIFKIEDEGIGYALLDYAAWKEIKSVNPDLYKDITAFQKAGKAIRKKLNSYRRNHR